MVHVLVDVSAHSGDCAGRTSLEHSDGAWRNDLLQHIYPIDRHLCRGRQRIPVCALLSYGYRLLAIGDWDDDSGREHQCEPEHLTRDGLTVPDGCSDGQ